MAGRRSLDDTGGKGCTRAFAKPHAKRQKRRLAELFNRLQMARLAGNMGNQAMIERGRIGSLQHGSSSRCHIAVDQHRDFLHAGGKNGTGHRRELTAAEPAQDFQRVVQVIAVEGNGRLHSLDLAREEFPLRAGARANPFLRRAAIEGKIDRGGNRGVADTHFADAQQIRTTGNGFHAKRHGGRAVPLRKRRFAGDITGRIIEREVKHLQPEIIGDADLVDRGTARGEIRNHLLGDVGRIGRDALTGHTMVSGKDCHQRAGDGRGTAGPGRQPEGDLFQTAKGARRLGKLGITVPRGSQRHRVRPRQILDQRAKIIKRQTGEAHGFGFLVFLSGMGFLWLRFLISRRPGNNRKSALSLSFGGQTEGSDGMALPEFITAIARSVGFLSRIPLPSRFFEGDDGRMEKTPAAFAIAGLVVAALPGFVLFVAGHSHAPMLAAVLAIGALVFLTGALHEDGLGDTADGLGGGKDRERALAIMKDSRIGSYGALALGLSLLVRVAALTSLVTEGSALFAALALVASAAFSRGAMVWHWNRLKPAKPDGVAASVGSPSNGAARIALLTGIAPVLLLLSPFTSLLTLSLAVVAGLGATQAFTHRIGKRLGGHTGDTIGATQQISDMVLLSALALLV